jgi:uncharacterized protein (UPF0261 family)
MIYPLADISGLNAPLVQMLDNAAAAVSGRVTNERASFPKSKRGMIGATQYAYSVCEKCRLQDESKFLRSLSLPKAIRRGGLGGK